ncbi:M48 family metallopeptidase [Caulobacter sp. RHG1]|uniref:M48 family metallopeptidase n=1 Tax=Caulobacter sp. (strain RHG1) TaxID=2545762 RepID=UPI00155282B6|nr:SprT family zinc-dependent metalloprotease [Caulobacter sp. RHG1]NQE63658.1 putative metal-dependent hydrolase [Caulobacter sp. RHG1]
MSTEAHKISVGGLRIDVVRKPIKNLHVGVYPPHGRVRVAAPLAVSDDAVRLAVVTRLPWIKRQRARFADQPRQSERAYVSGETHYFMGRPYRLRVIEGAPAGWVQVRSVKALDLYVRSESDRDTRERVFLSWYREELRSQAAPMIDKWVIKLDVPPPVWGIKRMKTKWGTCSVDAGRIWLNLELVKKPSRTLEYIVVHELVHFLERQHSDRFVDLMDKSLPNWRTLRDELNAEPLADEDWDR